MRKTKIICTLGPATDEDNILRTLILSGMDVARFNFSHGTQEEQLKRLNTLKALREELGKPVAALMDTKGPELRLGLFEGGKATLATGSTFVLTTKECMGSSERAYVNYEGLPGDVTPGDRILLDDAKISLLVKKVSGTEITCTVENDGQISDRKGLNVPGVVLTMPFISKKDYDDIIFAANEGFDFIAASFVRTADDVKEVRMLLNWNGGEKIKIIAKIECLQGLQNFDDILEASDGVMIARGDLGAELPLEEVPIIQKRLIRKVYRFGKPVITATQMLESMMNYPRPTRAEATDVANAIYDGTSAIMLSGETAAGKYPVEALRTMVRIAERAETDIDYSANFAKMEFSSGGNVTHAISHAACTSAIDLGAKAIVTFTLSGRSAQEVSAFRPPCRIIAGATSEQTCRQLNMSWGVSPLMVKDEKNLDDLFEKGLKVVVGAGLLSLGDMVVLTAGVPIGVSGSTNFIKVMHA
ncbi:MAG: pyruvate kinase [Oscillospiraceae bacterium]|nr:pyruvate kinase [Oscillospiraceae bacterium]